MFLPTTRDFALNAGNVTSNLYSCCGASLGISVKSTLRTNLGSDNAVVTKGWIVGVGFNQSWLQV